MNLNCNRDLVVLIGFACSFALGLLFNILACVFSESGWPIIIVAFYFFTPLPTLLLKNRDSFSSDAGSVSDLGWFLTGLFTIGGFAIPSILAHNYIITYKALWFALSGGVIVYSTFVAYLKFFQQGEDKMYAINM
ncbi:hypothetical protein SAMD00019534_023070 [Acytostelium subglobosum LB1]|uniref:hypothetical protein n=1 Tax=Acytostelium subglobosum LB1 TaxID=1410327 RepID=UPI000645063D|nr:hypothetical protein SAMD00019534_023070 [Acytostelium subglobosum LB1]GAM19132.1 hypothetical protein SAMD00019534_023070 [Acytostelium subglobosum LB1]|eukprot:XP_012757059.1 hypothetical protein SAMD00019534_023070 [Acytostelium subglobosum LB1]